MKKLMKMIDGNKTIISLLLMRLIGLDFMMDFLGPDLHSYVAVTIDMMFGGAIGHRIVKGKFGKDSN